MYKDRFSQNNRKIIYLKNHKDKNEEDNPLLRQLGKLLLS